jgi:hypothetical protein
MGDLVSQQPKYRQHKILDAVLLIYWVNQTHSKTIFSYPDDIPTVCKIVTFPAAARVKLIGFIELK